jgi:hypothetical protein
MAAWPFCLALLAARPLGAAGCLACSCTPYLGASMGGQSRKAPGRKGGRAKRGRVWLAASGSAISPKPPNTQLTTNSKQQAAS